MATHIFSNSCSISSVKWLFFSAAPVARNGRKRSGAVCPSRAMYPGQTPAPLMPSDDFDQDLVYIKHKENFSKLRIMLSQQNNGREAMTTIDCLKRLCIDHHFSEEIESVINSTCKDAVHSDDLFDATLSFRLMREAGYDISSDDILRKFTNENSDFKLSLRKDIRGLLSLHDISHLNIGEVVLYQANEFSSKHLKSCIKYLEPNLARFVRHSLEHPYHLSLQQYKARHHLRYLQSLTRRNVAIEELAMTEFQLNKMLHQKELQEITRWWRNLGLAAELPFARDQVLKWYMWSMTAFQSPSFSRFRVELTKVISFVYIVDDIFDLIGTHEELSLFTEAIKKWDITATASLPNYMRSCYVALYTVTNEIADMAAREHGSNPIYYFRKAWAMLFDGFMVEAKWFADKHVPKTDDYLRNGVITSGVPMVFVHFFFLLGQEVTKHAMELIEHNPPVISCSAQILRLWDDLGSAEDEAQKGFDGSYTECYLKENPQCSSHDAKEHVMSLIAREWEELNRECFSRRSFSSEFVEASLNCARMVKVMYRYYEEQKLPVLEEYVNMLLF